MSRRIAETLSDVAGDGGHVVVQCRRCPHRAYFSVFDLMRHCKSRRLKEDWRGTLQRIFRCTSCGHRPGKAYFAFGDAPGELTRPPTRDVPLGVSPREWRSASDSERKRLIRAARG